MKRHALAPLAAALLAVGLLAAPAGPAFAKEAAPALYTRTIAQYPSPKLADVSGREYKVLFDTARLPAEPAAAFQELWTHVKAAAAKQGFTVKEKAKDPLALEQSTKEYFDTKDQALWGKGYLVRITTRFKDGKPNATVSVTVKSVFEDAQKTLAVPLAVTGVDKAKTEAEENVGYGPDGQLRGYVEKGSSFSVPLAALGKLTLGDFGKYVPELLALGLPADTALVGTKAYAWRVRPGQVLLPGTEPCGISMEAWSRTEGGKPFLVDFSFGYGDLDYYAVGSVHAAGEQFMEKVVKQELGTLAAPDSGNWGGSKVRQMMNRPVPGGAAKAPDKAAKAAPKADGEFITSPTAPVDPLDATYGYASPPAYIKHYEADRTGKVLINPYLQVATRDFPAILDVKQAPYNWAIDAAGGVAIMPEAAHPLGRTYPKGFFRPEDQSKRKPGTRENYGHVSALGGAPGRISGEILYDKDTKSWIVNNKSGRYSKHNPDRTPEQLVAAAKLIRDVVDPGAAPWGQVAYLLAYAPAELAERLEKDPKIQYDEPAKKVRPHLILMDGAPGTVKAEAASVKAPAAPVSAPAPVAKPAPAPAPAPKAAAEAAKPAKAKKPKAAHNDDPS
jgi:hypothetical protein